jgi:hypothetical protein
MIKSQHVAANVIHVRDGSAITTIYICSLKEKSHLKGGKIGIEYSERLEESSSF